MGLLDILGGLAGGARGQNPFGGQAGNQGLSPIATALIALLAGKMMGGGNPSGGRGSGLPWDTGAGVPQGGGMPQGGGGIGDLLGGLLGGGRGGSVLSGGLNDLLRQFESTGHGNAAQSWIGRGENQRISPQELEDALGSEQVDALAEQAGLSRIGLLEGLSRELPGVVDQLTPEGRIPTDEEADGML
jgi:uncharacterized protein YidB (DUF937 family)